MEKIVYDKKQVEGTMDRIAERTMGMALVFLSAVLNFKNISGDGAL